jgi:hypothetical protein
LSQQTPGWLLSINRRRVVPDLSAPTRKTGLAMMELAAAGAVFNWGAWVSHLKV